MATEALAASFVPAIPMLLRLVIWVEEREQAAVLGAPVAVNAHGPDLHFDKAGAPSRASSDQTESLSQFTGRITMT